MKLPWTVFPLLLISFLPMSLWAEDFQNHWANHRDWEKQNERIEDYPEEYKSCLREILNAGTRESKGNLIIENQVMDKDDLKLYKGCRDAVAKYHPTGDYNPIFVTMIENVSQVQECRSCAEKKGIIDETSFNFKACLEKIDQAQKCSCLKVYQINPDNPEVRKFANYFRMRKMLISVVDQEKTFFSLKKIYPKISNKLKCTYPKTCSKFSSMMFNFKQMVVNEKDADIQHLVEVVTNFNKSSGEEITYQQFIEGIRNFSGSINGASTEDLARGMLTRLNLYGDKRAGIDLTGGYASKGPKCSQELTSSAAGADLCRSLNGYASVIPKNIEVRCGQINHQMERLCNESKEADVNLELPSSWKSHLSDALRAELAQYNCNYQKNSSTEEKTIFDDPSGRGGPIKEIVSGLSGFKGITTESNKEIVDTVVEGPDTNVGIMDSVSKAFKSFGPEPFDQKDKSQLNSPAAQVAYQRDISTPEEKMESLSNKKLQERTDGVDQRIKELEQQIAQKEKEEKRAEEKGDKKQSDGISEEVKKLLAELKSAKEENSALRNELTRREKVASNENQVSMTSQNSGRLSQANLDSDGVEARGREAKQKQNDSKQMSSAGNISQVSAAAAQSREKSNVANGAGAQNARGTTAPLLSFSYQDFVKMDKETFYKENKGKIVEVVKYDEKGNPVTYVLEPILNEQGEFVDYNLVEKSLKEVKDKEEVAQEKNEEKKEETIADKMRAFYERLKKLF